MRLESTNAFDLDALLLAEVRTGSSNDDAVATLEHGNRIGCLVHMRLGERNLELLPRLDGNRVLEHLRDRALLQERTALARHTIGGNDREVFTRRLLKLFETRAAGANHPGGDGGVNLD